MAGFMTSTQGLSHREIILKHLARILEISTTEFRPGYNEIVVEGQITRKVYRPSTIAGYIQSVDSLADVLLPFFDEDMNKKYEEIKEKISKSKETVREKMTKQMTAKYKTILEEDQEEARLKGTSQPNVDLFEIDFKRKLRSRLADISETVYEKRKLIYFQELFQELNLLLKRKEYLKGVTISEAMGEDDEEGETEAME